MHKGQLRTPSNAQNILRALANGDSLRKACRALGCDASAVLQWRASEPDFDRRYSQARQWGYEARADALYDIAHSATPEDVAVARLKLDHGKWELAKMLPKVYGDKVELTVTDLTRILSNATDAELLAILAVPLAPRVGNP